jgi:hypothetical protein
MLSRKTKTAIALISAAVIVAAGFLTAVPSFYSARKRAIIIVPGILNSALVDTATDEVVFDPLETDENGYCYDEIINPNKTFSIVADIALHTDILKKLAAVFNGDKNNFLSMWSVDDDGTSTVKTIKAADWSRDGYCRYGALEAAYVPYSYYYNLYGNDPNTDIFVFQYDWRLDNRLAAAELVKAAESYDDVILYGHSMGNLVTSLALASSEELRDKVILNVSCAAPYYGSYQALDILENGEETVDSLLGQAENFVSGNSLAYFLLHDVISQARTLCYDTVLPMFRKFPGVIDLLPTIELVCPDGENSTLSVDGVWIKTREQLLSYYQGCAWAYNTDGTMRSWVKNLGNYWDASYVNGVHASKLVNTVYIAGTGINSIKTMSVETSEPRHACVKTYSKEGDGTVELGSAVLGDADGSNVKLLYGFDHLQAGHDYADGLGAASASAYGTVDNSFKLLWQKIKKGLSND